MDFFSQSFEAIDVFMERGGPVLNLIAILLFVKWSLMIERFWFLRTVHKENVVSALSEWEARTDKRSWNAHAIRQELISRVSLDLKSTLPVIEVFYVMAVTGGGDAKQMSGGVARATIPTMAGMVGALSGIFASNILKVRTSRELQFLEDHMEIQHA